MGRAVDAVILPTCLLAYLPVSKRSNELPQNQRQTERAEYVSLVAKERPFVDVLPPQALYLQQPPERTDLFSALGTYAMSKTVRDHDVYIRMARPVVRW